MRVDTHVHLALAAYSRELQARALPPFSLPACSTEETLEFMQSSGIDRAVLSLSPRGVAFGDHGLAIELAQLRGPRSAGLPTSEGRFPSWPTGSCRWVTRSALARCCVRGTTTPRSRPIPPLWQTPGVHRARP